MEKLTFRMTELEFTTTCPVTEDGKHNPITTPTWFDEDDEIIGGVICKACGEELG